MECWGTEYKGEPLYRMFCILDQSYTHIQVFEKDVLLSWSSGSDDSQSGDKEKPSSPVEVLKRLEPWQIVVGGVLIAAVAELIYKTVKARTSRKKVERESSENERGY